ncbi:MAG: hypothetical protein CM1200mP38_2960 [Dehalococcoidia bacterium]|nr:MAG: hypothetical protein CM1200mP38_2960 [Dehalococcoidia bacterium]
MLDFGLILAVIKTHDKFLIIPVNTLLGIYIWWITAPLIVSATDEILGRYMSDVLGFAYAGLLAVAIIFLTRNILRSVNRLL